MSTAQTQVPWLAMDTASSLRRPDDGDGPRLVEFDWDQWTMGLNSSRCSEKWVSVALAWRMVTRRPLNRASSEIPSFIGSYSQA